MLLQERCRELEIRLTEELNRFRAGDKFCTVRELLARFGTSRRVVDGTLERMAAAGLLERRTNCGYFVRSRIRKRHVVFFHVDWVSREQQLLARFFKEEFALLGERYEFGAVAYHYQADPVRLLQECPADFMLICLPPRPIAPSEIAEIAACRGQVLVVQRNLVEAGLHCSFRRYEYAAALAVAVLRRNGHRKLALLMAEPPIGGNRTMADCFPAVARAEGCRVTVIPCDASSGNYSPDRAHDALARHLEKHGCDFTALFVISEYAARGALSALAEAGLRMPEEISMIAYGSQESSGSTRPLLSRIGTSLRQEAHELAQEIDRRWEQREWGERIFAAGIPHYRDRGSVRVINDNLNHTIPERNPTP